MTSNNGFLLLVLVSVLRNGLAVPRGKEHYKNEEHNKAYDHEAFLGEEAKTFDELSPEESQRRLGLIVDKIDKDKNGEVDLDELQNWIKYTQTRYIITDVDRQWIAHSPNGKDKISWPDYRKIVYGLSDDNEAVELDSTEETGGFSYKAMIQRDKRRWNVADEDEDQYLDRKEFASFLHPEEMPHMRDIVILETMEDLDKNKDGKISLDEFIGDLYQHPIDKDEDTPEWVKSEKEQFKNYRDKNNDGFLDIDEVKDWIYPPGFDHSVAEAKHLMYESDTNADEKLTKDEILSKYDLFVGSQATDFGEALTRHDEF